MAGRRVAAIAGLAGAAGLVAAHWLQRRRDDRAITADPAWAALQTNPPSTSREVRSADGTRLHVETFGAQGTPTIVLVHGWCCSLRFWHYQVRDLSPDYRVVAYDLRGHGRSERATNRDYSTAALGADLDAVLRACVPDGEQAVWPAIPWAA